jgi:DNA-binding winged helix-turn-helix (wHTH) protein
MKKSVAVKERRDKMIAYLKNRENEYVTSAQLSNACGCGTSTVYLDIEAIRKSLTDGTIESQIGKGYMFVRFAIPATADPDPVPKKNSEGYNDPTAFAAIKTAMSKKLVKNGDVCKFANSNGVTELFAIVRAFDDTSLVVKLLDAKYIHGNTDYFRGTRVGNMVYAADFRKIMSRPNKYITEIVASMTTDAYDKLVYGIGEMLGLDVDDSVSKEAAAEIAALKAQLAEKERLLADTEEVLHELEKEEEEKRKTTIDPMAWILACQKIEIYERLLFERERSDK